MRNLNNSPKKELTKEQVQSRFNRLNSKKETEGKLRAGKISLQRMKREYAAKQDPIHTVERAKAEEKFKKEDIASKIERQRNQRKKPKKKPTGAEGKDPKTVRSKRFPSWN